MNCGSADRGPQGPGVLTGETTWPSGDMLQRAFWCLSSQKERGHSPAEPTHVRCALRNTTEPRQSSALWHVLLFVSLLGIGYPAEVLDIDDSYAEEVYSQNVTANALPAVHVTPCAVRVVRSPLPETPTVTRWTAAAARRLPQGPSTVPSLALLMLPRRTVGMPAASGGTPSAVPSYTE